MEKNEKSIIELNYLYNSKWTKVNQKLFLQEMVIFY